jgi:hypothetical protein
MGYKITAEFEKLAAGIKRELVEIDRDIERMEQRLAELRRERAYKASGLVGIHYEMRRLNDNETINE